MKLEIGIKDCHLYPDQYTLCSSYTCVPVNTTCPCKSEEFQCPDKLCIPQTYVCNGRHDCTDGYDERHCSAVGDNGEMSVSIVISISVLSIGLCILCAVLLLLYIRKKYRRPLGSVDEPLQGENISSDNDNTDNEKSKQDINTIRPDNSDKDYKAGYKLVSSIDDLPDNSDKDYNTSGYKLVSSIDDFGNFGDELLCASTPKQGVRQIRRHGRNHTGNTTKLMLSSHTDLPDLLINTSAVDSSKTEKVNIQNKLKCIPYIDSSMEIINTQR